VAATRPRYTKSEIPTQNTADFVKIAEVEGLDKLAKKRVVAVLGNQRIQFEFGGSIVFEVEVSRKDAKRAQRLLQIDSKKYHYKLVLTKIAQPKKLSR